MTDVRRPALKYLGSKWSAYPWLNSMVVGHDTYIEGMCGGANFLLRKERVKLEIINDIDKDVVNFFRHTRDNITELARIISLTPWAEDEYDECRNSIIDDENDMSVERARRFFVASWMGGVSINKRFWRMQKRASSRYSCVHSDIVNNSLNQVSRRLQGVAIANCDAITLAEDSMSDEEGNVFLYLDPPYLDKLRSDAGYSNEVGDSWHEGMCRKMYGYGGNNQIMISGHVSDMYNDILKGWHCELKDFQTNSGGRATECVWLSPFLKSKLEERVSTQGRLL